MRDKPGSRPVTLEQIGIRGFPNSYGFNIEGVATGSPAANSGLKVGDYIVEVNCQKVETADSLVGDLSHAGSVAVVTISRPEWLPNQTETRRLPLP